MLEIRSLLTEQELAEQLRECLLERRLPEKFFYWFPQSVRAWLDLCRDGEYRNYVRSRSLIDDTAVELASMLSPGPQDLVSLGSGQGDKDLVLARALLQERPVRYVAVDASMSLLEIALAAAAREGQEAVGIKADIADPGHLARILEAEGPPRLVGLIGGTLGAFDPSALLGTIATLLRPGDTIVIDGELRAPDTMKGYDNPVNRAFAWAPLRAVGLSEEDGEVVFRMATDTADPGATAVEKLFRALRRCEVSLAGERLVLGPGERIAMSRSHKYEEARLLEIIAASGLRAVWQQSSRDARWLMVAAVPVRDRDGARRRARSRVR